MITACSETEHKVLTRLRLLMCKFRLVTVLAVT